MRPDSSFWKRGFDGTTSCSVIERSRRQSRPVLRTKLSIFAVTRAARFVEVALDEDRGNSLRVAAGEEMVRRARL
jgi:hypothetical protein